MHVVLELQLLLASLYSLVQVVDLDVVTTHHDLGDLVVSLDASMNETCAVRHRSRSREDECGVTLFQSDNQGVETDCVSQSQALESLGV